VDADLSSIPGLKPRHLTVLTGPLQIRTVQALTQADRRVVQAAMRRLRPPPALEEISARQDHARDLAGAAAAASPPGWEQAAAFVVSFEHRPAAMARLAARARLDVDAKTHRDRDRPGSASPGAAC
jgi:hypothetical protein